MTTGMAIRPRGDGDVEKAADGETASGTVGVPTTILVVVVL